MSDAALLPAPRSTAELDRAFAELVEGRMIAPARTAGLDILLVGATVLPQRKQIARTARGTYIFVDHIEDPTRDRNGDVPVPAVQAAKLVALDRAGVRPDHLWLAHELPADYTDDQPLPAIVPTPRDLREKDERLTLGLGVATRLFAKAVTRTLVLAAAAPLAVGVAAGAALGAGLDPVVLGGVQHPEFPIVAWAILAEWEWE